MAFEYQVIKYNEWLLGNPRDPREWGFLLGSIAILLILGMVIPLIWFLVASIPLGPSEAFYLVARSIFSGVTEDLPRFSMRRTMAIARVAIQEAIRNRVLVGFAVFVVLLLFAGLFLDVENGNPARVYLSTVLVSTNYLVLLMALFLSTFSLPNDIKNRTIYTVVTKPIRASEIVFGRIIGFAAVGTAMIAGMGLLSYIFVVRGLTHDHVVEVETVIEDESGSTSSGARLAGQTSRDSHHRHMFEVGPDGKGRTNLVMGHTHEVTRVGEGDDAKYLVGPPEGHLIARSPVFGSLVIRDRDGTVGKGINVGSEWEYRGYIEGGARSKSEASWTFSGITPERYPDGLPLELNLRVFRTFKGDIERGILGEIIIRNPNDKAKVRSSGPIPFESKEFVSDFRLIKRELTGALGSGSSKLDLFEDLVHEGQVEVVIRCAEPGQYFGVAQADVYLRPGDSTFELNMVKAYFSIWMQMLLVTSFGVTFSTFLSGPVAMLAALSGIILGYFGQFVREVATGAVEGGGPIESTIRLLTQQNVQNELDINGIAAMVVQGIDQVLMQSIRVATYVLPDYNRFDTTKFVANGYDIFSDVVLQQVTMAAVYTLVVAVVGYFFLKTREIAA